MKVKDEKDFLMAGTVESIRKTTKSIIVMVDGGKAVFAGKAKAALVGAKVAEGDAVIIKGYEGRQGDFMATRIMKHGVLKTGNFIAMRDRILKIEDNKLTTTVSLPMAMDLIGSTKSIKEGDTVTLMCGKKFYKQCKMRTTCMEYSPSGCMGCTTAERILYRIEAVLVGRGGTEEE